MLLYFLLLRFTSIQTRTSGISGSDVGQGVLAENAALKFFPVVFRSGLCEWVKFFYEIIPDWTSVFANYARTV